MRSIRDLGKKHGVSQLRNFTCVPQPSSIVSDEQRLGQILKNLLSNAFKFTETGQVTVSVTRGDAGSMAAAADPGAGEMRRANGE